MHPHPDSLVIDDLGGPTKVAEVCGGLTPQAVSQWRKAGIPRPWRKYLELLRPEVFARAKSSEEASQEGQRA